MSFNPCILVPAYNHGQSARGTLAKLATFGVPIVLVDDGSEATEAAVLRDIAAAQPLVRLVVLPVNQGKGGAVMAGLRAARQAGFTHALQVDADGQHDLAVLPAFLAAGKADPAAMVCGRPVYDASVPKVRKLARYLTHFWIWVETLSFDIKDSLCGFRLYPLAPVCALIESTTLPTRMDFDPEVLVRLHWRGLRLLWQPVPVTYPVDGRSHFRPFRDNARISWMHTRLVCAMPWNIAKRWFGGAAADDATHWAKAKERGSRWGLAFTSWVHRYLGRWLALPLIPCIVTYFFLTGGVARRASLGYLARLHRFTGGASPRPNLWNAYRIFLACGFAAHDKLSAWLDPLLSSKLDFPGLELMREARESGRGALVIGAHLGNLEMMRAVAARYGFRGFHAVVHFAHVAKLTGTINDAAPAAAQDLIHVSDFGPETAMRLREIVDRGECVVIVGDRTPVSENGQTVTADFLGEPAQFPRGPFVLAAALECPVYLFFCVRHDGGHKVIAEKFADRVTLPRARRAEELAGLARRYAERLEQLCVAHPLQWFNFFDFWHSRPTPAPHEARK
jgi:predicted LPLAT superfamily acyltransferase